jgi:hypothetical protein
VITRFKFLAIAAALTLIGGVRSASADQPLPQAAATPTPTPGHGNMQHATPPPASTPTPATAPASGGPDYVDDFTDPTTGWPNALVFDNYYIGYHEPEFFHVEVHAPHDKAIVVVPKQSFDDFTAETSVFVDPNNTAQTGDFRYGLVFRRSGSQFYAFVISPRTQTWYALKSSPSGVTELARGTNDAIQGLKSPDALRVDAVGSSFALHVNDQLVGQVSDADYAAGDAGFIVETLDSPRAHIHYDSLAIGQADTTAPSCTVVVSGLNLRRGPGTSYPILGYARASAVVEPLGRSRDGGWLFVRAGDAGPTVWISSAPVYIDCSVPIGDLPVQGP